MTKHLSRIAVLCLLTILCAPCASAQTPAPEATPLPDPPEAEWVYTLCIYWAWNMADEAERPGYTVDPEGVLEEGVREDPNADKSIENIMDILYLDPPPGGVFYDFRGVRPGDVTLRMQTMKNDVLLDETTYVIRVYDDLRLAVLDMRAENYR